MISTAWSLQEKSQGFPVSNQPFQGKEADFDSPIIMKPTLITAVRNQKLVIS